MKVEIDEVKKPTAAAKKLTAAEIYRAGNLVKTLDELYLVVYAPKGYALVGLDGNVVSASYKTLEGLIEHFSEPDDELIDVKIVRA